MNKLGHIISAEGLKPRPGQIAPLKNMSAPFTAKVLQLFIGLAN